MNFIFKTIQLASMVVPLAMAAILGYYAVDHSFSSLSQATTAVVDGNTTVAHGENFTIRFKYKRDESCSESVDRVAQYQGMGRDNGRQWVLQQFSASFRKDNIERPDAYTVNFATFLPSGPYLVFSRIRYYCDVLDYLWPRVVNKNAVAMLLVGESPANKQETQHQ